MEKVVPFMAMIYILAGLGILILNITRVPAAFMLIFKSAFTPMAGIGGFAGATVRDAIRYGVARGLYSNDAGTGYGMIAHASAKTDHPVRQASWGWGEVFLDTIVVCSVTALSLILTNVYVTHPGVTSARLTTVAFGEVYGPFGKYFMALAITVFAWTTIIGMYYSCEKSVNYVFGDTHRNKIFTKIYMLYYLVPCVFLYNVQATTLWAMTDILSGIYVIVTMVFIYTKQGEIIRLFKDFWDRYLPLKEAGENVPPVVYGNKENV
jgi:AGCS family alanine or glycine:cation symporter